MPTRLYVSNATAGYVPAGVKGAWAANSSSAVSGLLGAKAGASGNVVGTAGGVASTNYDYLTGKWISDPLTAQTISGTLGWCFGGSVSNAGFVTGWHKVFVWVSAGDTTTSRGTLLTDTIGPSITSTSGIGRASSANALSSLAVSAGDRIIVELGTRQSNASSTNRSVTVWYGNTGATDLVEANTAVTANPGWLEFSGVIGFGTPVAPTIPPGAFMPFFGF